MISSDVNFHKAAPLVRDIAQIRKSTIQPLSGWNDTNDIQFVIPPSSSEYISSSFILDFDFSIVNADLTDLAPTAMVTFLNNPAAAFWSAVRLKLNGTIIEGISPPPAE